MAKQNPTNDFLFKSTGYKITSTIAKTLQGGIHTITNANNTKVVLKTANIKLTKLHRGKLDDKTYYVSDNILSESTILKVLNNRKDKPINLIKLINFISDKNTYYMILEYGGISLFEHVLNMHKLIKLKKLSINVWKKHVQILFRQMVGFLNWLHNTINIAHLDISLENILLKDCIFKDGKFINDGIIKFIDFGVCQSFTGHKNDNNCKTFVGKTKYQSPEVFIKKPFIAELADVWSLGIVLFTMMFGVLPYNTPDMNDAMYAKIISKQKIRKWTRMQNKTQFGSGSFFSYRLINQMLVCEKKRISISKIMKYNFVNLSC